MAADSLGMDVPKVTVRQVPKRWRRWGLADREPLTEWDM